MNGSALPCPLVGIVTPLATPLLDRDRVDCAGLERLIEHVIAGGVSGLFILGSTGEAPSLSRRLRRELVERACAQVSGRVPVLVGITDTCFSESLELARAAAEANASAVVVAAPYYYLVSQAELLAYVERLAAQAPLPLFLYNMPGLIKLAFEPETVARAAEMANVVGLKDSSGSMVYFHRVRRLVRGRPDFSLLIGMEELLAEAVMFGAHGGVCGGANLCPRLFVELHRAAAAGDREEAERLHRQVMDLSAAIYRIGPSPSGYLRGLKCALSELGFCSGYLAEPYEGFGPAERALVREGLVRAGLLPEGRGQVEPALRVDGAPVRPKSENGAGLQNRQASGAEIETPGTERGVAWRNGRRLPPP